MIQKNTTILLPVLIIGFGIATRLAQYLSQRSLWADEAALALNLVERSWAELFQPLDYEQVAPIGFLLVEKTVIQLLGDSEWTLRLFPLLCGILSLFLFYRLARSLTTSRTLLLSLLIFAAAKPLIYYSSEVKQYSSDVAIALLCFLIAQKLAQPQLSRKQIGVISLTGALLVWFSHPAIFVLATAGIGFSSLSYLKEKSLQCRSTALILSSWGISFLIFYRVYLSQLSEQSRLIASWQLKTGFPDTTWDWQWLIQDVLLGFFDELMGLAQPAILFGVFFLIAGFLAVLRQKQPAKIVLLLPILATLIAAYFHKYPFHGRLILFLTPFMILLLAEGMNWSTQIIQQRLQKTKVLITLNALGRQGLSIALSMLLVAPFLIPIVDTASAYLIKPQHKSDIKMALRYIQAHQQPEDQLYVFQRGALQFKYYAAKFGYQAEDYTIGVDDLDAIDGYAFSTAEQQRYQTDLDRLKGYQRVWILFSHSHVRPEVDWIRNYLDAIGERLHKYKKRGVSVYLYNLSQK